MSTVEAFASVVELTNDHADWWGSEGAPIRGALVEHYGAEPAGHELTPPPDPAALRARLRAVAPRLASLTDRTRLAFDRDQACAVVIPKLGLAGCDTDERRKGVFALAALIGDPTANIPFEQVFWDVQNHGDESTRHTSFSENDREADYHADHGALPMPERFFLLYVVQGASCGGGVSMIRDGRVLRQQLERTSEGREAIRVLSEAVVPRRVPKAFRRYADVAEDGYKHSPIFSESQPPMWRWRKDKIYHGLAKYPQYATPQVRKAVDLVADVLDHGDDQIRQAMPTDGLLLVNNHIALHGRTAFTDPNRHLLRLRFHEPNTY